MRLRLTESLIGHVMDWKGYSCRHYTHAPETAGTRCDAPRLGQHHRQLHRYNLRFEHALGAQHAQGCRNIPLPAHPPHNAQCARRRHRLLSSPCEFLSPLLNSWVNKILHTAHSNPLLPPLHQHRTVLVDHCPRGHTGAAHPLHTSPHVLDAHVCRGGGECSAGACVSQWGGWAAAFSISVLSSIGLGVRKRGCWTCPSPQALCGLLLPPPRLRRIIHPSHHWWQ
jgi:hypothetical protein